MKKTQLTIITLALTACFLSSCKGSSTKAQGTNSSDSLTTTEAQAAQETDTLVVKMDSCNLQEGKNLDVVIRVDYPTGTDDLASNVRKILNQKMADAYLAAVNEDGSKSYKAYAGDLSNAKVVIEKYGKDNFKYLKEQIADIKKYDSRANINMCYELNLNKKAETDKYITYNCFSYAYLAGAHGSSFDQSFNIIKATGKLLTETVDTTQVKKLQPILRKGVLSYLNEYNKEDPVTDKNLNEFLFIENGIIPLPAHTPFLTKDGVHFAYQQYEIGPYAMGIVEFTIPYSEIKSYLTPEAAKLIQ